MILHMLLIMFTGMSAQAGTKVSFSPQGNCEQMTVDQISAATKTVDAAVYSLNNPQIITAYEKAKLRGVKVRILTDHVQAGGNWRSTQRLAKDKFDGFRLHSVDRIMHDKFVVTDAAKVITGSFNETTAAQLHNAENCIQTDDAPTVEEYRKQFDLKLWPENTQEKSDKHLAKIRTQ